MRAQPLEPLRVVFDRADDVACTRAAMAAHDPAAGRITVHPAPAPASALHLGRHLLAALGKPPVLPGSLAPSVHATWAAVGVWLTAMDIREVMVLRAHLLTPVQWDWLLALREETFAAWTVICHGRPGPALLAVLDSVEHTVAGQAWPTAYPLRLTGASGIATSVPSSRWLLLPSLLRLGAGTAGRFRECGCSPHRSAPHPATAASHRFSPGLADDIEQRLHQATAHPQLAAALAVALFTGAPVSQLVRVRLTDLSADASALTLHDPARPLTGCATYSVPAWAQSFLRAAEHMVRLVPAEGRLLAWPQPVPRLGLPELLECVSACRFLPYSPTMASAAPGRILHDQLRRCQMISDDGLSVIN